MTSRLDDVLRFSPRRTNRALYNALRLFWKRPMQEVTHYHAIVKNMRDAAIIIDQEGIITDINPSTEKRFGYSRDELLGENVMRLIPKRNREQHQEMLHQMRGEYHENKKHFRTKLFGLRKDGIEFPIEMDIGTLGGSGYFGIIRDITSWQELEDQLRHLATHDALTGLLNRQAFDSRVEEEMSEVDRYGGKMGYLYLDLVNFKNVNDTYGHAVGDRAIQATGKRLKSILRESDLVGRHGGDEFAIAVPKAQRENLAEIAEKIINEMSVPFDEEDGHKVGISIGIAMYPVQGIATFDELMKKAEKAMYATKRKGPNTYAFWTTNVDR